ncbi:hypothetical protein NBRC116584_13080 [Hydrogenophaga sp. 5NK40-0174]
MPKKNHPRRATSLQRAVAALMCGPLLLTGLTYSAHAREMRPAVNEDHLVPLSQQAGMSAQRGFDSPRATHCKRPAQTRQTRWHDPAALQGAEEESDAAVSIAGLSEGSDTLAKPAAPKLESRKERARASARIKRSAEELVAPMVEAERPPVTSSPAAAPIAELADKATAVAPADVGVDSHLVAPPQRPVVTAGMVNDNADFSEYLAFRDRTQVRHEERDIRERYLLEVKNSLGKPVPDAEVEVRSAQGETFWVRTDSAGKAWLHPNAFKTANTELFEVIAHQGKAMGRSYLQRGQKSAVEIQIQKAQTYHRASLDLVFMVDATGSMGDEIAKLKASIQAIANEAAQLPSQPDLCFGLVAYRDRGDAFLLRTHDFTNDLSGFQKVLNLLQAGGGGDTPEAMSEALHETVHQLSWRGNGTTRMVVLLADAPPQLGQDRPRYDEAMVAAAGKGIKIFSVGASGLDPQGEYIQRQLAQFTGGRFVFLTYDRAEDPGSGPGRETVHDVKNYSVSTLDQLIGRLIREELAAFPTISADDA